MAELEQFKTVINLTEYAASCGYVLDRKASSRNSAVMRHSDGDKIIIAKGQDGHWTYFSVHDDGDNGSIIDFVQHREGGTLGNVRQTLRPWIGQEPHTPKRPQPDLFLPNLEPVTRDRAQVLRAFEKMEVEGAHPYLVSERAISADLLRSDRFAGKVRIDERRNAIFAHHDQEGLCGYEIKNRGFTGFAKGGEKGLWFSAASKGDTTLVFSESAIDALSYACLYPDQRSRYASIGGKMNPDQPALIRSAIERMPDGARIIAATDNDPDGLSMASQIGSIVRAISRPDLSFTAHHPEGEGNDWNDVLLSAGHVQKPMMTLYT